MLRVHMYLFHLLSELKGAHHEAKFDETLSSLKKELINHATSTSTLSITENSVYNYNGLHYIILYYWYYMHNWKTTTFDHVYRFFLRLDVEKDDLGFWFDFLVLLLSRLEFLIMKRKVSTSMAPTNPRIPPAAFWKHR